MSTDTQADQGNMYTQYGQHYIAVNEEGQLRSKPPMWQTGAPYQEAYQKPIDAGLAKGHLVFFIHGGLNNLESVEERIKSYDQEFSGEPWHLVHLAWDTDIGASADEILSRWSRPTAWENIVRILGYLLVWKLSRESMFRREPAVYFGGIIWRNHYDTANAAITRPAANSADRDRGFYRSFQYLNSVIQDKPDAKISFIVHSAGSIVANYLLELIASEFPNLAGRVRNYILLAPACHVSHFHQALSRVETERPPMILNLTPELEEADRVGLPDSVSAYDKSILWAVHDRFEAGWSIDDLKRYRIPVQANVPERDTSNWGILGLEDQLTELGQRPNSLLEWTPPRIVERVQTGQSVPLAGHAERVWTAARDHGAFDGDPTTFQSIKQLLK